MRYTADLHLHSHYSRATSKDLNLETLYQWARVKGINVVGTGDFTHPLWFRELREKLEPDGTGFFRLKNPPRQDVEGFRCKDIDVRFCLTSEISSIYKQGDRVRKNHNCVYAPDFETVARINAKLAQIGNLEADGRPILGLPSRDLLEIVLETSEHAHLIPAHIWTPWFSMLGSKSGYDSVEECFRDLAGHIFALETGLSSDPEMNWRLSQLDRYTLVSNSDAHSPQKLGREVNRFDTDRSYYALFESLKTREGFVGTYEFFPEEGKYHMDGHRNCGVCFEPEESLRHKNLCPVCGQPLTIGVLHRVTELADRPTAQKPALAADYRYLIPLPEILSEIKGSAPSSKAVGQAFRQTISAFGNEFGLLQEVPVEDIEREAGGLLAEAIRRMRSEQVDPQGGYDGEYGVIRIFKEGELAALAGQMSFFGTDVTAKRKKKEGKAEKMAATARPESTSAPFALNPEQVAACETEGAVLVVAGPGTGKTGTLVRWIAHAIEHRGARPGQVMAVTFTNKAADELRERLGKVLGPPAELVAVGTFHALCFELLQERQTNLSRVYDDRSREAILSALYPGRDEKAVKALSDGVREHFERGAEDGHEEILKAAASYRDLAAQRGGVDVSDLVGAVVRAWKSDPDRLEECRARFPFMAVDELQDINPVQYEFLSLLGKGQQLFGIGDPDQSIYGFRGSEVGLFFRFAVDFGAQEITLRHNYRSSGTIVEAAQQVIRRNPRRMDAPIEATRPQGGKIIHFEASDGQAEAAFVVGEIEKLVGGLHNLSGGSASEGTHGFSDIAVLFRTRLLGRMLAEAFKKAGIPARFGDAVPFLTQPPFHAVADAIHVYLDGDDLVALHSLLTFAFQMDRSARQDFLEVHSASDRFVALFGAEGREALAAGSSAAVEFLIRRLIPEDQLDDAGLLRKEAILALAQEAGPDVRRFLRKLTLDAYTDVARLKADAVRLLTFHACKGLEFPAVFVVGAEEGFTPLLRQDVDRDEERRLFYVAMTRAKDALYLTHASKRRLYGQTEPRIRSRFVDDIPSRLVESQKSAPPKPQQMSLF